MQVEGQRQFLDQQTKIQKQATTQNVQQKQQQVKQVKQKKKQEQRQIITNQQSKQMKNVQDTKILNNQSNLLESQIINQVPKSNKVINDLDERPIGGNNKNKMSQYPEKDINAHDQQPIGGGNKFKFSQYPDEDGSSKPIAKKPVKKAAKKPLKAQIPNNQNVNMQTNSKPFNEETTLSKTITSPLDQLPVGGNSNNNNNKMSQFDEKPIASGNKNNLNMMSQYPQRFQQQTEPQKQYPMNQKLKSKAVKLRLSGMQDLLKLLQQNPDHQDINEVDIKSLLKQTAPANLQKSLQILKIWIVKGRKWGDQQIKNMIENGMAKTNLRKISIQICDLMYQQNPNTVQGSILIGMKGKILKNIVFYLSVILQLLSIYGIKRMKYLKPYIPQIVKLLNDKKDIPIKNQGFNILKQSYKWLGKDVIAPMLGDLKQALKKELDSFWESYDQTIVMKSPKGEETEAGEGKKKKKVDAYDLSQAVDVFKKFNQKWSQGVINAVKWNQKTKMLEQFVKAASVPKLANTDYRHISDMIKRLINDSNFNVVIWDLKVLACLSRGLRRHFYPVVKNNFSQVLGKFRDKKTQMIQETFNTLTDFMYSISLDDVIIDIKQGLQDKAPNMKVNVLNWIARYIEAKAQQKGQVPDKVLDALKLLFGLFQKLLNDGNVEVRDCMARNIFKMKLSTGDDFFASLQAKMNKNLVSKASTENTKTTKGKQIPAKKQKSPQKQMNKTGSSFKKIQNLQKSAIKNQNAGKKQQKKASEPELKLQRFEQISFDDCCTRLLQNGFPDQQLKNIKAQGAKQRTNVFNIIKTMSLDLQTTFTIIKQLFKDWKEVNLLMNKQLIAFIDQKAEQIQKPQLLILIPFMIQKIGDSKFSQTLFKSLQKICQKIPGIFIVGYFIQKIKSQQFKKPKLNIDVCTFISRIIQFVSISNIPVRQTIIYANQCYKNQFAKKGGLQLLKKIYSYIGDQIKIYLQAQTFNTVQGQFKKTKILSQEQKKSKVQFSGQAKKNQKTTVNLLQNKPKIDITQDVLKYLSKMNDNGNWQKRKQSAQAIINLINDNFGRVTIQCMGDLMNSLKLRINDPNKQLIKSFMQLSGILFSVLNEKQLKVYTKMFVNAIADGLSDKMDINKKQAATTLNKIGQVVGKQQLLGMLSSYLETDKQSRIQIINIMLLNQQFLHKTDMKDFAKGLTNCLCDKNKDIRNSAEKLFQRVYEKIGMQVFRNIAKNQKPALMKDLNSIYDKYQKQKNSNYGGSQSYISKASSPSKDLKPSSILKPPPSAQKKSLQKNKSYFDLDHQDDVTNRNSRIKAPQLQNNYISNQQQVIYNQVDTYVQGDQMFASVKILSQFRVDRQERNAWRFDQIKQQDQDTLRQQIQLLIRRDMSKKMFSLNSRRVSDATLHLIKLCKDITYQNHFRQIYDLIIKWVLLRMWGGNTAEIFLLEIIPPILFILQKKKLVINDAQVDLIILVIRQYFITSFMNDYKVSESLYVIVKVLVSLSSGQKVLKKIFKQYTYQLTAIHKHVKKQVNLFYRQGLNKLTKLYLMQYIGNQDYLQQASRIKQLRGDQQFVDILFKKYHQAILTNFGFKSFAQQQQNNMQNLNGYALNQNASRTVIQDRTGSNDKNDKSNDKVPMNNSRINLPSETNMKKKTQTMTIPRPNTNNAQNTNMNSSMIKQNNDTNYQTSSNNNNNQSNLNKSNISASSSIININEGTPHHTKNKPSAFSSSMIGNNNSQYQSTQQIQQYKPQQAQFQFGINSSQQINLSVYPTPHPISPLGKHLSKLTPFNQQTIRFFTQLFSQHGQKIANQLTTHSKIIFASILKSVMIMLQARNQIAPQKIVTQMNLLQQCIKCKYIMRNIDELLYTSINFALKQLVYQDQHKTEIHQNLLSRGIQYKTDQFSKVINGAMLRILQNGNSQEVTNNLIRIHNQYVKTSPRSLKTFCLIVKCTTRAAQSYTLELKLDRVVQFFILINQYFVLEPIDLSLQQFQLSTKQKPKPEENFLNSIKSVILELGKILNSDIWQLYDKAMAQAKYQDNYIGPYISSLKIKQQQKRVDNRNTGHNNQNNSRQNEQIKKISQLLSKNKTFETGILHLKKFCNQNMSFNPVQYFTSLGYDQKFIAMVMNSLQGKQRRTPRKDSNDGKYTNKSKSPISSNTAIQQQQNISQKIKKLKQKFQQIQPSPNTSISQKHIPQTNQGRKQSQQPGQTSKDQRAAEIKRRIDQMKSRLNQNFDKPR